MIENLYQNIFVTFWFIKKIKTMDAADVVAIVVGVGIAVVLSLAGVGYYLRRDTNKQ